MTKLDAKQLRTSEPTEEEIKNIQRNPIYLVIDEVLDTYNIGSMFRLADAVGVKKVYLCGNMEYPPSIKIHRSAVGTENWTPWEKRDTTIKVIEELKKEGVQIISVEQDERSIDYRELTSKSVKFPTAIVVGHETKGVQKEVLDKSDLIVELPMMGINKSFNVWGTTAVIAYKIVECLE